MATFDIKNFKIVNQVSGIALAMYIDTAGTAKSELMAAGYFNTVNNQLAKGSVIIGCCSDGNEIFAVDANQDGDVAVVNLVGGTTAAGIATLVGPVAVGAVAPTFLCNISGTTFASKAAAELLSNYTFTAGTTGLTVASGLLIDDNTVKFTCTGTAVAGTFTVAPKTTAVKNGLLPTAGTLVIA